MPRGRKPQLKVGDAVTLAADDSKKGVIVHVHTSEANLAYKLNKPYYVHFHPTGAGNFSKEELLKTKPNTPPLKEDESE